MKNIGKAKKILSFVLAMVLLLGVAPLGKIDANAASWSSDYRNWSQAASDIYGMRLYGCWVVAQAKMIYEADINREASFNPDTYYWWQKNNGYIDDNFYQTNGGYAPVAYANQRGKSLEYLGYWSASDDQLWFNINAGYYTIVHVENHYVLIANELSKQYGQLYCYDSWTDYTPSRPQPLTRYANHYGGYVYKASNSTFSNPQNIGDDFYAAIIKNDGWAPIAPVDGNVQIVKGTGDASEIWHFVRQSDNSYVIYNCKSGKVLDVKRAATDDGAQIIEFDYWSNQNQQWFIYGRWSGEYVLKPKHCDKVLDVYNNESAVGTKVHLWSYNQTNAQKFAIYKFDKVGSTSIKVSAGNSETKTTFSWSKAANATLYNLKIMTGTPGNLKSYKTIWSLKDTSYSLTLPAGYYEAWVDACTVYHYTSSNHITFNIEKGVHNHSYTSKITTAATCTEPGVKTFTCSCGDKYTEEISALGHADSNNDGQCDRCGAKTGTPNTPNETCNHICHSGGFLWKIIRFFCKIFRTNKYCTCGAAHY